MQGIVLLLLDDSDAETPSGKGNMLFEGQRPYWGCVVKTPMDS